MTSPEYTHDFVERGYDNRAAVPDHPAWFERFARLSAATKAKLAPKLDLRYGPNPKETLDLFLPSGPCRGTFVFIHGGYWRALDKADHLFVAEPFVEQGYAVAVINYDLCPAVGIATIVDECRRAVAWLVREGERHGARAAPMVVGGHSAGGHLAAMMVATPAEAFGSTQHPVAGAVSLSGVHDLRPLTRFSYNVDLKLDQASASALSPVLHRPATDAAGARRRGRRRNVGVHPPESPAVGRVARKPSAGCRRPPRPRRPTSFQRGRRLRRRRERADPLDAGAVRSCLNLHSIRGLPRSGCAR